MKFTSTLLITLIWTFTVNAQQLDLAAITCDSLAKTNKDQVKAIVAWLSGYYSEENGPQVINLPTLDVLQDKLMTFCAREGSFTISAAAEGIFGRKTP